MEKVFLRHYQFWDKKTLLHFIFSMILLGLSLVMTFIASSYTNNYVGMVVPDMLLDNLPVINVGFIFFQGAFLFVVCLILFLLCDPKYIPFVLGASSLFYFIRSVFMVLTHLSAPSVEIYKYIEHKHHVPHVIFTLSSGNDMFFSGHAGYPFLLALMFWRIPYVRYFFLLCSLIGGVAVILGHLHYSIDVFSSYFIAFGIFEIAKKIFHNEYNAFLTK